VSLMFDRLTYSCVPFNVVVRLGTLETRDYVEIGASGLTVGDSFVNLYLDLSLTPCISRLWSKVSKFTR
jgi:hypothetical protein